MRSLRFFFRYLALLAASAAVLAFIWVICLSVLNEYLISAGIPPVWASAMGYFLVFIALGIVTFFGVKLMFHAEASGKDGRRPRRG